MFKHSVAVALIAAALAAAPAFAAEPGGEREPEATPPAKAESEADARRDLTAARRQVARNIQSTLDPTLGLSATQIYEFGLRLDQRIVDLMDDRQLANYERLEEFIHEEMEANLPDAGGEPGSPEDNRLGRELYNLIVRHFGTLLSRRVGLNAEQVRRVDAAIGRTARDVFNDEQERRYEQLRERQPPPEKRSKKKKQMSHREKQRSEPDTPAPTPPPATPPATAPAD